jgi:RND superfamily putative drug exporter
VSAVFALSTAGGIIYLLAKAKALTLSGQSQGILSVLVLGAATDYALLLISRYREELHHHESVVDSMRVAYKGTFEPILASGLTVIAGLLVLLLSDLKGNQSLGPVGAIGIAASMVTILTLLPALLVVFGRWIFWPRIPKFDDRNAQLEGFWAKVGNLVARRPKPLAISTAVVLLILAGFSTTLKADGLSTTQAFTGKIDSVVGQEKLLKHFPGGQGQPTEIVVNQSSAEAVASAVSAISGVASIDYLRAGIELPGQPQPPIKVVQDKVILNATLDFAPDSEAARKLIPKIREVVKSVDKSVLVGGGSAVNYDVDVAAQHDNRTIIPIVLILIALILTVLLRSILAGAILLATVVLSYFATIGVCQLVFEHIFNFPGADTSFPLFAFIFLVALGIDYNIFLMTRVREESIRRGTREGVIRGLTVTGGVITSAGIVLAATFAVLGVLPLVFLAELGFAVGFGVLLDTIVVRSLLVPSIVRIMGKKIWWPSKLEN